MRLWNIWVLGVTAIAVAACGTGISLGDTRTNCSTRNTCVSSPDGASTVDSSASIDAGAANAEASYDADAYAESGQPVDSGFEGPEADSGPWIDSVQPDSPPDAAEGGLPDGNPGGSTISGSPDGARPFSLVSNAWWIQYPDPRAAGGPVVSTVVYLFSKPVPCDKLNVPKWDELNEPGDTQDLEIEMAWSGATEPTSPPTINYAAVPLAHAAVPAPGMAGVFYHLTAPQPPGPSSELGAISGTVALTGLNPATNVTGTFDVMFAGGHSVTGSFNASHCPNGREP